MQLYNPLRKLHPNTLIYYKSLLPLPAYGYPDCHWSKNLTEVRSICPHFGIMEQQSGAGGWTTRMEGPAPRPGQLTLWAMQSVAHGADYISFFRWRTCTFSTEMYWHGILDYDNRDNRKLAEVKDFYKKYNLHHVPHSALPKVKLTRSWCRTFHSRSPSICPGLLLHNAKMGTYGTYFRQIFIRN